VVRRSVYLDHAATTSLRPEAAAAWLQVATEIGNPSSLHAPGRAARRIVEESRESVAAAMGVRPSEIIFTAGGTEADNLAIKGLAWGNSPRRALVCSPIEHHAVLDPVEWLVQHQGFEVRYSAVDDRGRVDLQSLEALLDDNVAVCSVMWANNEMGTVQPVGAIAAMCGERGIAYHCDAVQALGMIPMRLPLPGLTALTLSGHKIGAPVGVGALIADRDAAISPLLHGGGQERDIRSGTVDAAGIAAFAVAVQCAVAEQEELARRLIHLRTVLVEGLLTLFPDAMLQGDPGTGFDDRLPGNVSVTFAGCEGDALLMLLDAAGISCSTGSACTSGVPEPSHVLLAMGVDPRTARGTLRFSLGRESTMDDVETLLEVLPSVVERARRAGRPRLLSRS
jgi:cysteine desulfurase